MTRVNTDNWMLLITIIFLLLLLPGYIICEAETVLAKLRHRLVTRLTTTTRMTSSMMIS